MMKSRSAILLVLLALGILMLPGCSSAPKIITYQNPEYTIQYPSDWTKSEEEGMIAFKSPVEDTSDTFQELLTVKIILDATSTLDEITTGTVKALKESITDINLLDSTETTLSGYPAHKVIYSGKSDEDEARDVKMILVWAIKENQLYLLTYAAEADTYSNYLGIVDAMMNSFTFVDSTQPASS